MDKEKLFEKLNQDLPTNVIYQKDGYDYVEGWNVIDVANHIFGYFGWSNEIISLEIVNEEKVTGKTRTDQTREGFKISARCIMKIVVHPDVDTDAKALRSTFTDVGFGSHVTYRDKAVAYEKALKQAQTDATKRCLRHYGKQFGLYLYDRFKRGRAEPEPDIDRAATIRDIHALAALIYGGQGSNTYIDETLQKLGVDALNEVSSKDLLTWINTLKNRKKNNGSTPTADAPSAALETASPVS